MRVEYQELQDRVMIYLTSDEAREISEDLTFAEAKRGTMVRELADDLYNAIDDYDQRVAAEAEEEEEYDDEEDSDFEGLDEDEDVHTVGPDE